MARKKSSSGKKRKATSKTKRIKNKIPRATKKKAARITRVSIGAALERAGQELRSGRNDRNNR